MMMAVSLVALTVEIWIQLHLDEESHFKFIKEIRIRFSSKSIETPTLLNHHSRQIEGSTEDSISHLNTAQF